LTPHFGVAATSRSFSASAKLAVVMDKATIPPAGGLAASTCRERRRAPAKTAESSLPLGPSSVVRLPLFAIPNPPSSILGFHPQSAQSSVASAKEELSTLRNSLIIKPHPAQSCQIKPNTATNVFRSQSHQIKPNQTIENETRTPVQI
jgi:hypothetical protein